MKKLLLLFMIPFLSFGQEDCLYNEISIIIEGSDTEIGWNIAQDNGWAIVSGALNSVENACIEDGCWTFNMYDGVGDGWVNTSYTIYYSNSGEVISSGTLYNGNFDSISIQIGESIPCYIYGCMDVTACNYNEDANVNDGSCEICSCADTSCTEIMGLNLNECNAFVIKDQNNEILVDFSLDTYMGWCGANPWTNILSTNYCFSPGCYTLEMVDYCVSCPQWWDPSTFGGNMPGDPTIQIGQQEFFYQDDSFCEPMQFSFDGFNINEGCNLVYVTDTVYIDNFITDTIVETEYVDVIITEYIDCDTGLPCESGISEILDKSKTDGRLYNLLGQEINRREGIYIEGGEVKYRLQ